MVELIYLTDELKNTIVAAKIMGYTINAYDNLVEFSKDDGYILIIYLEENKYRLNISQSAEVDLLDPWKAVQNDFIFSTIEELDKKILELL